MKKTQKARRPTVAHRGVRLDASKKLTFFRRKLTIEVVPSDRVISGGHEVDADINRITGRIRVAGWLSSHAVAHRVAKLTIIFCRHVLQQRDRARRRKKTPA